MRDLLRTCSPFWVITPWSKRLCRSGLQWEDFWGINPRPGQNCDVRVGCNGLLRKDFWGISPWSKLQCKSGRQWEDFWGVTPWSKLRWNSALQWENFWRTTPPPPPLHPRQNWNVRVGCKGPQWDEFWGINNWSKIEGVICSEGVKWCKSWAAKGG